MNPPRITFERVVTCVILLNFGIWLLSLVDPPHEELYGTAETACLIFFEGEMISRLREEGWAFFRSGWNDFDLTVILVALLPVLGVDVAWLRAARVARLFHLGRHAAHFRLADIVRDVWRRYWAKGGNRKIAEPAG
jgi:hypothetical protein